jgi:catechol 2,3-dioxygenase-like lactoylglutathione lyase family enzyme
LGQTICHDMRWIARVTLVVPDYDEAIAYYTSVLGFTVLEDRPIPSEQKRWVVIAPGLENETGLVLGKARTTEQTSRVGNQTGGRVFLFLHTDNFEQDYQRLLSHGVKFVRPPATYDYGRVAVFEDLYGNWWDLFEPAG